MKHFLIKTIKGIAILLLIFLGLNFFVFPNNDNQMHAKYKLLETQKEATVLILGNSHTFFGINPAKSSFKMINIANKGRKIETDYYLLKENIDKLEKVKVVILPISHCKMHVVSLTEQEKRLYYNYYKVEEYKQSFFKNSLIFNEPFRELINDALFKNKKINSLGWRANSKTYKKDTIEIKNRIANAEGTFYDGNTINCSENFILKINTLCKKYDKKLVLLIPPYHPDYYRYSNVLYQKNVRNQLRNLSQKHQMFFIDGKDLGIKNDSLFENVDHLNINGAAVFTKKIDSILQTSLRGGRTK